MYYQFPAVVNIEVDAESSSLETQFQDQVKQRADSVTSKSSTMCVNSAKSLQSNNDSSDTDVYTDTEDDDDDDILQEERKSLFSALKSKINVRGSVKSQSKQSKPPEVTMPKETSCHLGGESRKMSKKNRRTSTIVDLSFSDDDSQEDQNSLHSYATKTKTTQDDGVLVETQKSQINKTQPPCQTKNAGTECLEKNGRKLVESSPYNNDTDSCEDSDDLPCVLPSMHSGSEESSHSFPGSCTDNYKSSDSRVQGSNLDSQEDSEIPAKRKKRSAEEIIRQRNEALVSILIRSLLMLHVSRYM